MSMQDEAVTLKTHQLRFTDYRGRYGKNWKSMLSKMNL